jgi:hypothetical protein
MFYESTYGRTIRDVVLIDRSIEPITLSTDYKHILAGKWICFFSGDTITEPKNISVITLVSTREAWRSGGNRWNTKKKNKFSNYLDYEKHLIVIKKKLAYERKSREPTLWLPEINKCGYLNEWTSIKSWWGLSMDRYEKKKIKKLKRIHCK